MPLLLTRRADSEEVATVLNRCIDVVADSAQAYEVAAAGVRDVGLRALFQEKSRERHGFLVALESALIRIGAYAEDREGAARVSGDERTDREIVQEWARREEAAVSALRRILAGTPLSALREDIRAMLANQYAALVRDRDFARRQRSFPR
jgi:hypothetical protein